MSDGKFSPFEIKKVPDYDYAQEQELFLQSRVCGYWFNINIATSLLDLKGSQMFLKALFK